MTKAAATKAATTKAAGHHHTTYYGEPHACLKCGMPAKYHAGGYAAAKVTGPFPPKVPLA